MEIRNRAELDVLYPEPQAGIMYDSPELLLMRRVAENDAEGVASLFREKRQFSDAPPAVDTPYGRFEGKEQIRAFAEGILSRFEADRLSVQPKFQTRSGGRSVTEVVLNFERDGVIDQVPMFVAADLGSRETLEEVRMYCHSSFVPHLTPYRKPLFTPAHLEMGDPGLMTGAVREELGRIAMSGIAAYMRGEDGRLISIRISDYAWMEKEIDWSQTGTTEEDAMKVNAVPEFPAGVGRKNQETL